MDDFIFTVSCDMGFGLVGFFVLFLGFLMGLVLGAEELPSGFHWDAAVIKRVSLCLIYFVEMFLH